MLVPRYEEYLSSDNSDISSDGENIISIVITREDNCASPLTFKNSYFRTSRFGKHSKIPRIY